MARSLAPTMREVARAAGVDCSTVSLALRNQPRIAASTRARIQEIAAKLGYRSHPLVSALMRTRRTGRRSRGGPALAYVATVEPGRGAWFIHAYYAAAKARAEAAGFSLQAHVLGAHPRAGERLGRVLRARGVRGILAAPLPAHVFELKMNVEAFSLVSIGHRLRNPLSHRVAPDHFGNTLRAVAECRARGYRRIGAYCPCVEPCEGVFEKMTGALWGVREFGGPEVDLRIATPRKPGFEEFVAWVREQRPEVIISSDAGLLRSWLKRGGWRVPGDIGLVSVLGGAGATAPEVSGVYEEVAEVAGLTVDALVGAVQRNETGPAARGHDTFARGVWIDAGTTRPRLEKLPADAGDTRISGELDLWAHL